MGGKMNKEYYQNYYQKNKDKINKQNAHNYQKNKEQRKEQRKEYVSANKNRIDEYHKKYRVDTKNKLLDKIIQHYGGKCCVCLEERKEALILHHIFNGGGEHRKSVNRGGIPYYRDIANKLPEDILLLCGTCHTILHRINGLVYRPKQTSTR